MALRDTVIVGYTTEGEEINIVVLTEEYEEYDNKWVGTALELGVSTYADTLDEVRRELGDAIELQLNEVEHLGFIDEYLQEHNVRKRTLISKQTETSTRKWGLVASEA
ncbi:MAG: hypothetical protein IIC84_06425 [Chloroflexi bacterium]|nr:hypothetical protein [Chloroflexota bacterium]